MYASVMCIFFQRPTAAGVRVQYSFRALHYSTLSEHCTCVCMVANPTRGQLNTKKKKKRSRIRIWSRGTDAYERIL